MARPWFSAFRRARFLLFASPAVYVKHFPCFPQRKPGFPLARQTFYWHYSNSSNILSMSGLLSQLGFPIIPPIRRTKENLIFLDHEFLCTGFSVLGTQNPDAKTILIPDRPLGFFGPWWMSTIRRLWRLRICTHNQCDLLVCQGYLSETHYQLIFRRATSCREETLPKDFEYNVLHRTYYGDWTGP